MHWDFVSCVPPVWVKGIVCIRDLDKVNLGQHGGLVLGLRQFQVKASKNIAHIKSGQK